MTRRTPISTATLVATAAAMNVALLAPSPGTAQVGEGGAELPAAAARSGAPGDRFEGVRAYVRQVMAERQMPSVSLAVAQGGRVIWEEAFGWADRERRIAATPHTTYSLASISKPFTATAVMMLAERGLLTLDAPVNEHLGRGKVTGFAGDASDATLRRVLSHTAGLPVHYQFFYEDGGYDPPPRDATISRYGVIVHPPGSRFHYSNIGFGILDHIVTRASGRSYGDFLRTEIFTPLGLTRTSVDIGPGLAPYAATRYDDGDRPIPFYDFDHPGASAVFSSAHDLVRFGLFHLGHDLEGTRPILSEAGRASMQRRITPGAGDEGYGMGWAVSDEYGHRKVFHTGSMPGVGTMLALYPDDDVAIVVLMNNLERDLRYEIQRRIADVVIDGYAAARAAAEAEEAPGPIPPFAPGAALVGTWRGSVQTWSGAVPLELTFQEDGDVHVTLGDQLTTLLSEARVQDGYLIGRFGGTVPTEDAGRHLHTVQLNLRLDGRRLAGEATAQTGLTYYSLTSWAELERQPR